MSGLMARIRSRRADGAPPAADPQGGGAAGEAAEQPTAVVPARDPLAEPASAAEPAALEPPAAVLEDPAAGVADGVPAGAEIGGGQPAAGTPRFRERGRLRRRLRYLRRVRELGFRDLGGLVFDLDRFGRERPDLVRAKLDALRSIDGELRAIEVALDDARPYEELREAGVSACATCGALHGSEARFCPACGTPAGTVPEQRTPVVEGERGGERAEGPATAHAVR